MIVAKRMLDSRSAATSAMGAWVNAQTAIQYEASDMVPAAIPVFHAGNIAENAMRPRVSAANAIMPMASPITIQRM